MNVPPFCLPTDAYVIPMLRLSILKRFFTYFSQLSFLSWLVFAVVELTSVYTRKSEHHFPDICFLWFLREVCHMLWDQPDGIVFAFALGHANCRNHNVCINLRSLVLSHLCCRGQAVCTILRRGGFVVLCVLGNCGRAQALRPSNRGDLTSCGTHSSANAFILVAHCQAEFESMI